MNKIIETPELIIAKGDIKTPKNLEFYDNLNLFLDGWI